MEYRVFLMTDGTLLGEEGMGVSQRTLAATLNFSVENGKVTGLTNLRVHEATAGLNVDVEAAKAALQSWL